LHYPLLVDEILEYVLLLHFFVFFVFLSSPACR
jgi:hypothetical protein